MKCGWAITEKEKLVHWQWIVYSGKVGAVLCSAGCLAPSLVFNQQMQVAACSPVFPYKDNCWVPRVLEGRISTGRAPLILAQMYILWLPRWVCMCLLGMEMGASYILLKCPLPSHTPALDNSFSFETGSLYVARAGLDLTHFSCFFSQMLRQGFEAAYTTFRYILLELLFLTLVYSWVTKGFGLHHCLRIDVLGKMRLQVIFEGWRQLRWSQNLSWSLWWALSSCWLG